MPINLKEIVNKEVQKNPNPVGFTAIPGSAQLAGTTGQIAPSSEPALISSAQGAKLVTKKQDQLASLKGEPLTPEQTTEYDKGAALLEKAKGVTENKDFATYVNPATGQETTLRGDALSGEAAKDLEAKGFQVVESDVSGGGASKSSEDMKTAKTQLDSMMAQLEGTAISSKELRQQISRIKGVYNSRIAAMERINQRREATLNTLGVRLGSRYTGGTFDSIVSEEERQGQSRVLEVEAEMLATIQDAESAAKEQNYSLFTKLVDEAQEQYDKKQEAYNDLEAAQKKADEELKAETKLVESQASIIEQIQAGTKDPFEIFTALGGDVPYDVIKEITDTIPKPEDPTKPVTLGSADLLVNPVTGEVIARGSKVGGAGGSVGNATGFGTSPVSVGNPSMEGLGTTYENSTVEAQLQIDDIVNGLPTQLINNVAEIPRWREAVRKQMQAGYTPQQVIDKLSGFRLFEGADKGLGTTFFNLMTGTDMAPQDLSSLMNRGAVEQAMTTVENAQLSGVKSFFADTDKARSTVKQADQVLKLLNDPSFPKDKLGAFDGRVFKLNRQVTPKEQVKVQQLESALNLLNAPIRVEIVGTAATEAEMGKITGFQADVLDQPEIVLSKVTDLRDSVLRFHNEARSQRGLPQVDNNQLIDNKKRLELYKSISGEEKKAVSSQMNNTDFLSTGNWEGSTPTVKSEADNKDFFNGL